MNNFQILVGPNDDIPLWVTSAKTEEEIRQAIGKEVSLLFNVSAECLDGEFPRDYERLVRRLCAKP